MSSCNKGFTFEEDMAAFDKQNRRIDFLFLSIPLVCVVVLSIGLFFYWT